VTPSEAGGYACNTSVAEQRVQATIDRMIELTRHAFADLEYPGIICALGGDMASGGIHPELAESDEMGVIVSAIAARDLIINAIAQLADYFGRLFVPCAMGNHGRVFDRKARAKGYANCNIDYLIYTLVRDSFMHDDRICVMVNDSGEPHFNVYGTTFLLTHDDMLGAKGGDGVIAAIGPIMRGSLKTMKSLSSLGKPVDHLIIGHWHHSLDLPEVTVCGSLKSPDEYAVRMLRLRANVPSRS